MPPFVALVTLVLTTIGTVAAQQPPLQSLKIVVLEGEGAVNIIQQKTAVRPLIEVRDRNNVPVAGASVTFTIGGGGQSAAFAGGAQTLTVTTNAAGQAAASGLNAVSSGAFQIQVQAAYQGQVATAAISQTNFATAAAAQAGAGAGAGTTSTTTGAAGGTAGGGGGISATTIGIIGAAVAGGAVAATQLTRSDEGSSGTNYSGSLSGQLIYTSVSTASTCLRTQAISGTVTIQLNGDNATGTARAQVTQTETGLTGPCIPGSATSFTIESIPVSGGPSALTFNGSSTLGGVTTNTVRFSGSLTGSAITGTFGLEIVQSGDGTTTPRGNGSTSFPLTLQR
jgi:hypothetical protein